MLSRFRVLRDDRKTDCFRHLPVPRLLGGPNLSQSNQRPSGWLGASTDALGVVAVVDRLRAVRRAMASGVAVAGAAGAAAVVVAAVVAAVAVAVAAECAEAADRGQRSYPTLATWGAPNAGAVHPRGSAKSSSYSSQLLAVSYCRFSATLRNSTKTQQTFPFSIHITTALE